MLHVEAQLRRGAFALALSVEAPRGRCLAIAGPSGAGKSTALRVIAGLLAPDRGRIRCGEEWWLDTDRGLDVAPERRGCGYVFQNYALFGHMPVWRNVAYGLRGVSRRERRRRAGAALERFGLERLAQTRPASLSGGERQRVALARALAPSPSVLLLDEPLSALDARTRATAAREVARALHDVAVTSLLVTHDFTEAALLGDRVAVVDGGRVLQEGTPSELAAAPASAFVADFTGAVVLTGVARRGGDGLTYVALDGGGTVAALQPAEGRVAVSVYPWEIAVEPPGRAAVGSARNRLTLEVTTITALGSRVRLGLNGPQPVAAEVTEGAVRQLRLRPGDRVDATWKATATRVLPLG